MQIPQPELGTVARRGVGRSRYADRVIGMPCSHTPHRTRACSASCSEMRLLWLRSLIPAAAIFRRADGDAALGMQLEAALPPPTTPLPRTPQTPKRYRHNVVSIGAEEAEVCGYDPQAAEAAVARANHELHEIVHFRSVEGDSECAACARPLAASLRVDAEVSSDVHLRASPPDAQTPPIGTPSVPVRAVKRAQPLGLKVHVGIGCQAD